MQLLHYARRQRCAYKTISRDVTVMIVFANVYILVRTPHGRRILKTERVFAATQDGLSAFVRWKKREKKQQTFGTLVVYRAMVRIISRNDPPRDSMFRIHHIRLRSKSNVLRDTITALLSGGDRVCCS